MKIVVDDKIPFLDGVFPSSVELVKLPGAQIGADDLRHAQAMIVRTRTKCNKQLLDSTSVKYIATATIGYDHIDLDYCQQQGIAVATSAGCNAGGVVQYVMAALAHIQSIEGGDIRRRKLGIVGCGNVGGLLAKVAKGLGFGVICCDPLAPKSGYVSFEELIQQSDIISFHTPLTRTGTHPTYAMVDGAAFDKMRDGVVIINSSRGEVISQDALVAAISSGKISHSVIDVWDGEPIINNTLLQLATIATPHIAGYSLQGKAMGSAMAVRSIATWLGISGLDNWYPQGVVAVPQVDNLSWSYVCENMQSYYDILADTNQLKQRPNLFEQMRENYNYRSEFF